jgi:hypothetical protein
MLTGSVPMIPHRHPRVVLVGDQTGPLGWELHDGAGSPRAMTFAGLAAVELHLRTTGEVAAADALGQQRVALARIAEAWRQISQASRGGEW